MTAPRAVLRGATPARSAPLVGRPAPPAARTGEPSRARRLLSLQATAGNGAVSRLLAGVPTVQLAPPPGPPHVLNSLTVAGGTAVVGAADTFVAPRGGVLDVTANVTPGGGRPVTARDVRWAGGAAAGSPVRRRVSGLGRTVVTATVDGVTKTVTLFVADAPRAPAANPAAPRAHVLIGVSNPGGDFGLTVVTIGQQGVVAPTFVFTPFFDAGRWSFRLVRVRHGFKVGVNGQGRRNIAGPGSVTPATLAAVVADLTPPAPGTPNGPPRATFWNERITRAHEQAHVDRFYSAAFWDAAMTRFETTLETATVVFDPAAARTSGQVRTSQTPVFTTSVTNEHNAADAAEIGGSEVVAHGVSNPMYTALLTAVRAAVRPPGPTGPAAAPGQHNVVLTWAQDATVTNGATVERSVDGHPFAPAGAVGAGVLTLNDNGLPANTRVRYRIRALGTAGPSAPVLVNTRTTP